MLADIHDMRAWLDGTDRTEDVLALAWDAFDLIRKACRRYEDYSRTEFAAYAMAAAAAVSGRNIVAGAPSIPPRRHTNRAQDGSAEMMDAGQVADALAALAAALSSRLTSATLKAARFDDQHAGEQAAAHAEHIRALLTPG